MRVVVVGSGVAGLVSAWLLSRRHDVTLVERQQRLGGHTNTVDVSDDGRRLAIDTGFIVYNERTYPLFSSLLDELDVPSRASDMSWSMTCGRCDIEYAGDRRGLFAQPRTLFDASHLRMAADIVRFNHLARTLVRDGASDETTIGRFLLESSFSDAFRNHYLLPMASAIWSTGTREITGFPLATLLTFLDNHGLLAIRGRPAWRTVDGGASRYVRRLIDQFSGPVITGAAVAGLSRSQGRATVRLADGRHLSADRVVLATHADEALALLDDPDDDEKRLLGAWRYSRNDAVLHTDRSLMPSSTRAWASWNYRVDDCRVPGEATSLTYHMNRLQGLDTTTDHFVTLNAQRAPRASSVHYQTVYTHPVYDVESVASIDELDDLNGRRGTFYAGAYHRNGFHEDAVFSAVRVAEHLGVRWPR